MDDPFVGQTLLGTYQITKRLGQGGMGAVYEAQHTRLPQRFAVKMLLKEVLSNPEVWLRFRHEAEISSALRHSHVVQVIDFAQTPSGEPFMVMEYLDGEDLATRIQRTGSLSVLQTTRIGLEVASGLTATHAAGVVHRDLKPQNIFLCRQDMRDDFPKILDFGISKIRGSKSVVTRDAQVLGTPYYMSPEQALGRSSSVDHRTDIFSLGAILYECLTGRVAFDADSMPSVMYLVVHEDPQALRTLRPDVPVEVDDLIRRAMAKHPDARYQSMAEMADALGRVMRGFQAQAYPLAGVATVAVGSASTQMAVAGPPVSGVQPVQGPTVAMGATPAPTPPQPGPSGPQVAIGQPATVGYGSPGSISQQGIATATPPPVGGGVSSTLSQSVGSLVAAPPPPRRRGLLFAGIAAGVVVVAGGVIALTQFGNGTPAPTAGPGRPGRVAATPGTPRPGGPSPGGTAAGQPVPSPAGTPGSPETPTAPAAPRRVRIEFHVQPTGARLLVDGAPVTSPLELAFSTATHKLRAEADGYQAEELPFVADSNRTLQLRLTPLPAATAPRAGRGGGKAAAGRGKPAAGKKSKDTPILID